MIYADPYVQAALDDVVSTIMCCCLIGIGGALLYLVLTWINDLDPRE